MSRTAECPRGSGPCAPASVRTVRRRRRWCPRRGTRPPPCSSPGSNAGSDGHAVRPEPVTGWELVGVPYTSMARPGGIASAIDVLRSAGLAVQLAELGVQDAGDLALEVPSGQRGPSGLLNEQALSRLVVATRDMV